MTHRLLLVDDDAALRRLLRAALQPLGYRCEEAVDGAAALALLAGGGFSLVLADLNMPRIGGLELLGRLVQPGAPHGLLAGDVALVVMTGEADLTTAVATLKAGAADYLAKPLDIQALPLVVERALERRRLQIENREYQHALERMVDERTAELLETYHQTLQALGSALDTRDPETQDHAVRVVRYTEITARAMGVHGATLRDMEWGAMLHDVGKIGVPDAILFKPGPLTAEEWAVMCTHPEIGYQMLRDIPFLQGALPVVRCHHERWDGTGYPNGLARTEIPLAARIFKLSDVFDALTTRRPYRLPYSFTEACDQIRADRGTLFDPAVVDVFERVAGQFEALVPPRAGRGRPVP